jgi:superfamily II DNA or RNA helicase
VAIIVPIYVDNVYSRATITNRILGDILVRTLAFESENFKYSRAYKTGKWDGRTRFGKYSYPEFYFPTGLLLHVVKILHKNKIKPMFKDLRVKPTKQFDVQLNTDKYDEREYQKYAICKSIKEERGIIELPTSAGKTFVLGGICAELGVPTMVLVNTKDLFIQTARSLMDLLQLDDIGIIGGGNLEPSKFINVGILQTLGSLQRTDKGIFNAITKDIKCLIVDEVHHVNAKAKMFRNVCEAIPAYYRYGMSATPRHDPNSFKAQDAATVAVFGPTIVNVPKRELIEQGYLVPVEIEWVTYDSTAPIRDRADYMALAAVRLGEAQQNQIAVAAYQDACKDCIYDNDGRNAAIQHMFEKYPNEQILVMVTSIDYGTKLAEMLGCPFVNGSTDDVLRAMYYKDFKSGKLRKLVATKIYSEGVSFENLGVVILAEPFKSHILTVQKIGRLMRLAEGKERGILVDFNDSTLPFFSKQCKIRYDTYVNEGCKIHLYNAKEALYGTSR